MHILQYHEFVDLMDDIWPHRPVDFLVDEIVHTASQHRETYTETYAFGQHTLTMQAAFPTSTYLIISVHVLCSADQIIPDIKEDRGTLDLRAQIHISEDPESEQPRWIKQYSDMTLVDVAYDDQAERHPWPLLGRIEAMGTPLPGVQMQAAYRA